jgi:hypothetical protein
LNDIAEWQSMISSKLRQRLQATSEDLYARLLVVEMGAARPILEYVHRGSGPVYTTHGLSHISAVERNYDWLLSDADISGFNPHELFCLLCATFFHDSMMMPLDAGDERAARREHVARARRFLAKNHELIGVTIPEVEAIAEIIRGHSVENINDVKGEYALGHELIDLRKLGACLSLADMCHADNTRAPEIVYRTLNMDSESDFHWRRHLQISGITRQGSAILMTALTFSSRGDEAVQSYQQDIKRQLEIVRPYFQTRLTEIRDVRLDLTRRDSLFEQPLHFTAETPAIVKLLIDRIYQRDDAFIRELVQNALDACLIRAAKDSVRKKSYEPRIPYGQKTQTS